MDPRDGLYFDRAAVLSLMSGVRLCQVLLGCVTVTLVAVWAGYDGPFGVFCLAVWCLCLAASLATFLLEVTRLRHHLPVSWGELTTTVAMLAAMLSGAASVLYPVIFLRAGCPYGNCGVRVYRIAATACSCACCAAYAAEVRFARTRLGHPPPYMATASGRLKVAQAVVAGVTFGALSCDGEYARYPPALYSAAVFGLCLAATMAVVTLAVSGRPAASRRPFERRALACGLAATLLYSSSVAVWHIFCVDSRQGGAWGPSECPRGSCPWDSRLAVAVFAYVNLLLHAADTACALRTCCAATSPGLPSESPSHIFFLKNTRRPQSTWTHHRVSLAF